MNDTGKKTSVVSAWQIQTLTESARYLESAGDITGAEGIYQKILEVEPYNIRSLAALAAGAMERKDDAGTQALLGPAFERVADQSVLHEELGRILSARGQTELALASFLRAIEIRPTDMSLRVCQAQLLEMLGRQEEALAIYVRIARSGQSQVQASERRQDQAGIAALVDYALASFKRLKYRYLVDGLQEEISAHSETALARVLGAIRGFADINPPDFEDPLQRPDWLYLPGLRPQAFFDGRMFEWVSKLESHATGIKREVLQLLSSEARLEPYVKIDRDLDAMQWATLNYSDAWSSFHLYKGGLRVDEHCARCPLTLEALQDVPLVQIDGHAPEVFFSVLRPGAHIPPHFGLGNHKLAVHLPLLVPNSCAIRVGRETRSWTEGACMIFDDSFEHEAWNKSSQVRVVLIMEIWNPDISAFEREAIRKSISRLAEFNRKVANI